MGGSVFICDNNRIMFSVMGSQVFKHFKTLSFDLRACFIFQKFDKQLRCSVFTFVQYRNNEQKNLSNILGGSSLTNEKDHHYFLNRFVCVGEFFDG